MHVVGCLLRAGPSHPGKFVELQPSEVDVFVNGHGNRNPFRPGWAWLCYGGCLRLSAFTLLVLMFAPLTVCGKDPGVGSQEVNMTLQNDRIAVFSDSLLTAGGDSRARNKGPLCFGVCFLWVGFVQVGDV